MLYRFIIAILALLASPAFSAELTAQETRWLLAAAPVLAYSQQLKLPIDIVVQPQPRPNDVPLAMGFDNGRCRLVVSLRNNPDAETVLDGVPEQERGLLIEAMAAHEIGHCWRYAQGTWHALPAGFIERPERRIDDADLAADYKAMRETRREEGYADLVALAWIGRRHPDQYDRVYAWFDSVRGAQPVDGNAHDTRVWVRLARAAGNFVQGATAFDDAAGLWNKGLLLDQ
ncbi:MAG: hypothetical protein ABIT83_20805 [Massilia sp.]